MYWRGDRDTVTGLVPVKPAARVHTEQLRYCERNQSESDVRCGIANLISFDDLALDSIDSLRLAGR